MPLSQAQPDALARLYASSIFELAESSGQGADGQSSVESTLSELEEVLEVARANPSFAEFLSSRILGAEARAKSLGTIFKGRLSDLSLRFLLVLNDKGRLGHLPAIVAALDEKVQEAFGRVEVDLYTASPVSSDELHLVRDRLRTMLGKEPIIHPYVDRAMIGGLKVQIGDRLIDSSVATKLRRLRDQLSETGGASIRAAAEKLVDEL